MLRHFKSILNQQKKDHMMVLENDGILEPERDHLLDRSILVGRIEQIQATLDRLDWDLPYNWDENTVKPRCARHDVALKKVYVRDGSTKAFVPLDHWWECPECEPDNRLIFVQGVNDS